MHENPGVAAPGKRMHDRLLDLASALAAVAKDLGDAAFGEVTVVTADGYSRMARAASTTATETPCWFWAAV